MDESILQPLEIEENYKYLGLNYGQIIYMEDDKEKYDAKIYEQVNIDIIAFMDYKDYYQLL